jgi:mRNA interferase RelE/StbE
MTWTIRYEREAESEIDALDPSVRRRVLIAIGNLARDPRSAPNVKAMKGSDAYRLRVGDWRVVYTLHDDVLTVLVVRVAHRRDVYR